MPPLTLPVGQHVHVWHARLSHTATSLEHLSSAERERASAFVDPSARQQFVEGRTMLRTLLAEYLGTTAAAVTIAIDRHGKPALASPTGGDARLHFSISHSGSRLVMAVAAQPVGVDVERRDPRSGADAIAERFFAPAEVSALRAAPAGSDARRRAFFACWTRKEAVIKALGDGLAMPLRAFTVSVPPAPPALIAADDARLAPARWSLADLDLDDDYAGAVAMAHGGGLSAVERSWTMSAEGRPR